MAKIEIRRGRAGDIAALDALLARSYPKLLAADYAPSVLVTAIPLISRAQPGLVTSGTYFVALAEGRLVGGGGWTRAAPGRAGGMERDVGHIRHFATDAGRLRRGIGAALMARVLRDAQGSGIATLQCLSTITAVPFYRNAGFEVDGPITIALAPGIDFPAVKMHRRLGA